MSKIILIFFSLTLMVACSSSYLSDGFSSKYILSRRHTEGYIPAKEVKLYYQSFGTGEPIIVLHGGPGLNQDYLLPYLIKLSKNHQVIFYDQRGSGRSIPTALNKNNVNVKQFVEDVEILRKSLGLEKFILVGHSWGGMLAMQYAIKHSRNVKSMVLLNSLPSTASGIQDFIQEYLNRTKAIEKQLSLIMNSKEFVDGEPRMVSSYFRTIFETYCFNRKDAQKITLKFTSASAQSGFKVASMLQSSFILKQDIDLKPKLRNIKVPTLIIHGDYDPISVPSALEISQAIPNSQFILIRDCGHFPYIEKPRELFKTVNDFLKQNDRLR